MLTTQEREDVRLSKVVDQIWAEAQEILFNDLKRSAFDTFIRPTKIVSISNGKAVLAVMNEFGRDMIRNRFLRRVEAALSQAANEPLNLEIVIDSSILNDIYAPSIASISIISDPNARIGSDIDTAYGDSKKGNVVHSPKKANLNLKYTFASFVVGSHNRFCHSAALAVTQRPGQSYNPLFIYGGVGLGKTHIMQAIGHEVLQQLPHAVVRYISCERFTNDLINSIRDDRMIDFRKRYRQLDVLLVDDIQFIQGKESTQEEFFYTFNHLRDNGKQIVISSDRPPKSLSSLEERLRSRFEWGLIADIQQPDFETRVAILRKKSEQENIQVPSDVIEHIASVFTNNIRELEGALIRAHAYSSMTGVDLTVSAIDSILHPVGYSTPKPTITLDVIIETVAQHYRIESSEMRSTKRSHDLALPRHVAMYLAHEIMQMSFPRIGQAFANRKHTSALYAFSRVKEAILKDPQLAEVVNKIIRQLSG